MTVLVYAVPADSPDQVPSLPPPPAFWGLSVVWEGVDGSTWDLSDWTSGIALLLEGFEGLHFPPVDADVLTADGVHGQIVTGIRILPRSVGFRIGVFADNADDWAALDQQFWASWHPLRRGRLTISSKRGSRSIRLRLNPSDGYSYRRDPNMWGAAVYQLDAIADRPLWAGDQVVTSWSTVEVQPFLDPSGSPPFWVTPRNLVDSAELTNPGDVDVWPIWQVTADGGPITLSISAAGGTTLVPPLASGQTILIDTDPISGGADRGVLVDGVLTSPVAIDTQLGVYQPRRVPAGATIPVGLALTGPGRVSAALTPLHWRGLP